MEVPVVTSLSPAGYISDPKFLMMELLTNYFLTDGLQSIVYEEEIKSLPKTYYLFCKDPARFAEAVRNDIDGTFRLYFEQVDSDSRVRVDEDGYATAFVYVSVIDHKGKRHGIGGLSQVDPKGYGKILEMVSEFGEGIKAFGETK